MNDNQTWYCITSVYFPDGTVRSGMTGIVNVDTRPPDGLAVLHDRDVYIDWFSTSQEANLFANIIREGPRGKSAYGVAICDTLNATDGKTREA